MFNFLDRPTQWVEAHSLQDGLTKSSLTKRFVSVALGFAALSGGSVSAETQDLSVSPFCSTANSYISCRMGNGSSCDAAIADIAAGNPSGYRQILTLPGGYISQAQFELDAERLREKNSADTISGDIISQDVNSGSINTIINDENNFPSETWSTKYKDKLLYLTSYSTSEFPVNDPREWLDSRLVEGLRDDSKMLTANEVKVRKQVNLVKSDCSHLDPWAVNILFDINSKIKSGEVISAHDVSDNATLPKLGKYGIARISNSKLENARMYYIVSHEMGHSAMGWGDEYIEQGLESAHANGLDKFSSLILLDQGINDALQNEMGILPMLFSQVMYGNGRDNTSLTSHPRRVNNAGSTPGSERYLQEGAHYGKGIWRMIDTNGRNLMQGSPSYKETYTHSSSQERVIEHALGNGVGRANDRIVNAGPPQEYIVTFSAADNMARILIYDEDKNHPFHPTLSYQVRAQYTDYYWTFCSAGFLKLPCYISRTLSVQKTFPTTPMMSELDGGGLIDFGVWAVNLVCDIKGELKVEGNQDLCLVDDLSAFANSVVSAEALPYQDAYIPTPRGLEEYRWSIRTWNGKYYSGWTSNSKLWRAF